VMGDLLMLTSYEIIFLKKELNKIIIINRERA